MSHNRIYTENSACSSLPKQKRPYVAKFSKIGQGAGVDGRQTDDKDHIGRITCDFRMAPAAQLILENLATYGRSSCSEVDRRHAP